MEPSAAAVPVVGAATVDSLLPPASCGMGMWKRWKHKIKIYEIRVEDTIQPNLKQTQNAGTTNKNGKMDQPPFYMYLGHVC
jgi:hypothetical protein